MNTPQLLFELSPWFILLCALTGLGYAYLLYTGEGPWSRLTNSILGVIRAVAVFLICFLLLGPFLKQVLNSTEKPAFIFALDDSRSITQVNDSSQYQQLLSGLQQLATSMEERGFETAIKTIGGDNLGSISEIRNEGKSTNLDGILKSIQSDYEGRNVGGVLLVSDGIYNQGLSPTFSPYNFNIYTLGLGDSIPREDITLRNIYYNKIAYQGNKFPLVAEVINSGFTGRRTAVRGLEG